MIGLLFGLACVLVGERGQGDETLRDMLDVRTVLLWVDVEELLLLDARLCVEQPASLEVARVDEFSKTGAPRPPQEQERLGAARGTSRSASR